MATLMTKRSPIEAENICSGITLESEQQTTNATWQIYAPNAVLEVL